MQWEVDYHSRIGSHIRAVRLRHLHTQVKARVIQVEIQLVGSLNKELIRRTFRD